MTSNFRSTSHSFSKGLYLASSGRWGCARRLSMACWEKLIMQKIRLTVDYWMQVSEVTYHIVNWVPSSEDILEKLKQGDCHDGASVRILELSIYIAISDHSCKGCSVSPRHLNSLNGSSSHCNWITGKGLLIHLLSGNNVIDPSRSPPWTQTTSYSLTPSHNDWYPHTIVPTNPPHPNPLTQIVTMKDNIIWVMPSWIVGNDYNLLS